MKISISRNELYNKLAVVQKVINIKSPIAVTQNFLFNINGEELLIMATDLETTLSTTLKLEGNTESMICAMPTKLMEILKELPEQIITLEITKNDIGGSNIKLSNESGSYKSDFIGDSVGDNGDEFPQPKELEGEINKFEISSEMLLNGVSKTLFATAEDESRPTMTGVFFDIKPDDITFVATDAHKLVKYNVAGQNFGFEGSFILPKKPALTLKNTLFRTENAVEISYDDKNIVFHMEDYQMVCRRIEGRYPSYNSVIPNNQFKAIIDRSSLLGAVKRVKIFANQGTGLLKFVFSNNNLEISAQDIDFSTSAKEDVVCQYGESPITIGFKAILLEEILANMQDDQISIELEDSAKAGIIVPFEQNENEELLMLLMPMFLN